jgi:3',5'-cyclic AMP phosphodiesterase CpdA
MSRSLSRRDILKGLGAAGLTPLLSKVGVALDPPTPFGATLRVAHLTDIHVMFERNAEAGIRSTFAHLRALPEQPDLVLFGGDMLHRGMSVSLEEMNKMASLFRTILKDECPYEKAFAIGNHDIWGWFKGMSKASGDEALYGKRFAMDLFGMEKPYRSFDRGSWHFVILDSVHEAGPTAYRGFLDDAQFEWLEGDLAANKAKPTLVLTHIPVLQACVLIADANPVETGTHLNPHSLVTNNFRVCDLFSRNPQVKVVLSGHIHFVEDLRMPGPAHICSGAVSGTWWQTPQAAAARPRREGEPAVPRPLRSTAGYQMLELEADGSFTTRYVESGWKGVA